MFEESVKSTNQSIQRACSLHAPQGADETRYPSIGGSIDRKRKRAQEPSAHSQKNPNAKRTNKAKAIDKLQSNTSTRVAEKSNLSNLDCIQTEIYASNLMKKKNYAVLQNG